MTSRRWMRTRALVALSALLALVATGALFVGTVWVPPGELLAGGLGGTLGLRASRVAIGIVVGAALSAAGVIFQAVLRNPLAEPYVLGVSSGAGLGAAVTILSGAVALWVWALPAGAFVGGLLTMVLVYRLARVGARVPVHSLLLAGVAVGAVIGSVLMFLVSTASVEGGGSLRSIVWWLLGSLQITDLTLLAVVGGAVLVGVVLAFVLARDLNVMVLGEEPAAHLGLSVERTKLVFFALGSLLTGVSVAACGLIGFVGLIVPHTMRMILGPDHRTLLPCAALAGAVFIVVADTIARTALAGVGTELPIGVVTALMGGPFFIALLRRQRRVTWS
ncbi:MAG: iron ABC transporter permease [Planctomycetes bacterium]|nr:iron ABC transporter permease [Planctomycetota bacterium]